jgi:hypothetical protein
MEARRGIQFWKRAMIRNEHLPCVNSKQKLFCHLIPYLYERGFGVLGFWGFVLHPK